MKKILLFSSAFALAVVTNAQQIGNGDMEQWETVLTSEEPVNWNSFLTAGGLWSNQGDNQIEQSSDVRPGSPGTKSARIWSRAVLELVANGNMTLGKVNMGAVEADHPNNYNQSIISDPNFSEVMTSRPDSIVFWVKFLPVNSAGNEARMKATLHNDYNYRDPEDAASADHAVARAIKDFSATNGWKRMSVPFVYEEGEFFNSYILVTFATNKIPGGGTANDQLWIDDVELIYSPGNPASLEENSKLKVSTYLNEYTNEINIVSEQNLNGNYSIVNLSGKVVQSGNIENTISFNQTSGMYVLRLEAEGKYYTTKIVKK